MNEKSERQQFDFGGPTRTGRTMCLQSALFLKNFNFTASNIRSLHLGERVNCMRYETIATVFQSKSNEYNEGNPRMNSVWVSECVYLTALETG